MRSLISAFAMYSRIPMPPIEWKEENRRYALCFFPLIGAVIGAVMLGWQWLCNVLGAGDMLFAVGCTVIPIAITGGIHLDGFCDVSDAKASCAEKEKALEIMKDSRVGAFAVIDLAIYLLIQTALFAELRNISAMLCAAPVFVLSRSFSGLAAVTLKCAKKRARSRISPCLPIKDNCYRAFMHGCVVRRFDGACLPCRGNIRRCGWDTVICILPQLFIQALRRHHRRP